MDLIVAFDERLQEIDAYLELLDALERQIHEGAPRIGRVLITAQQQKILYSSVYLQLYNLVEATATWCIQAVTAASADGERWRPGDLSDKLRHEWIRCHARTHVDLNVENRLATAIEFFNRLIHSLPVTNWEIEKGGGGNWDDIALEDISTRIGFELRVSREALSGVKRKIREDKGALGLVKLFRNRLAHGSLSFSECGDGVTVADLRDIKARTEIYLREVVNAFRSFVDEHRFLIPESRPVGGRV